MMNAFSEGLVLAERSGLEPGNLLDVLVRIVKNKKLSLFSLGIKLRKLIDQFVTGTGCNCQSNV